jgi:hypothetical protein
MKNFSDFARDRCYNKSMGILDNLENAWDQEFQFESTPMVEINSLGEKINYVHQLALDEEVIDN